MAKVLSNTVSGKTFENILLWLFGGYAANDVSDIPMLELGALAATGQRSTICLHSLGRVEIGAGELSHY
jgi:hypothetical protein